MKCFNEFVVDVLQLRKNGKNIKSFIGDKVKYCAVVKADGYGAGLETVCKGLRGIADFFACACLKEALRIRSVDMHTPILILGMISTDDLRLISDNNISISVGSIGALEEIVAKAEKRINIHLQINTGLNRFGIRTLKELAKSLKIIDGSENVNLEGMYSHFATKSEDKLFINKQYMRFLRFKERLKGRNVICHIANSYATLNCKNTHLDMVRDGYLTYGYMHNKLGNVPITKVYSHIVHIHDVKKGDTIGYDRTFVATKSMRIAVIPIGYADGLNRRLSNKFYVLIKGMRCQIVGRICMDVCMVDISNANAGVGDRVVILGNCGSDCISIENMASVIDTSPYEVICNFRYTRMNYIAK